MAGVRRILLSLPARVVGALIVVTLHLTPKGLYATKLGARVRMLVTWGVWQVGLVPPASRMRSR